MTRPTLRIVRIINPAGEPVPTRGISNSRVGRIVSRLLAENLLCSMASVTAAGRARINTACFCYSPELEIYFLSHQKALHCKIY
jgi:hypothetical protein